MTSNSLISIPTTPRLRSAYDVFSGDADGICAMHQLRLAYPRDALLVTGVKRDISLLQRIRGREEIDVCALGVSFDANAAALRDILGASGQVRYYDHRPSRLAFQHSRLQLFGGEAPAVCTSVLVDFHLQGRFRPWAVVGALGENQLGVARRLAREIGLDEGQMRALQELGLMLDHNSYGDLVEDLHVAPDTLYRALHQYADPFDFIDASPHYCFLARGYRDDVARMAELPPCWQSSCGAVYVLPATAWSRRIADVFANRLGAEAPGRSFAVLTQKSDGAYTVRIRSGRPNRQGANGFCESFRSDGGDKFASGIASLPAGELDNFVRSFAEYFAAENGVLPVACAA